MAKELLLTSQLQNVQQVSCCLWDYNNGNLIHVYKNGGAVVPKTLNVISNDYLIAAERTKPLLHAWPINKQEPIKNVRLVLPEIANVIAVCPKNTYLAAGIGSKLYVWRICSGKLISMQQLHYQSISCIKFSSGLEFIVVGGEDGMVVVYQFAHLLSPTANEVQSKLGQVDALYKRMDHSMPITDIHVTKFGLKSRFATISSDQTLRLYQLNNGQLLLTLIFDDVLTALQFDAPCFNIYAGDSKGDIMQVSLTQPRSIEENVGDECPKFVGHASKITCLDINLFNNRLASASDVHIFIWDLSSRQILNKIELKAAVTNLKFVLTADYVFDQQFVPETILAALERAVNKDDNAHAITFKQSNELQQPNDWLDYYKRKDERLIEKLYSEIRDLRSVNKELSQITNNN